MERPTGWKANPQAMAAATARPIFGGDPELGAQVDGDTWLTPRYILDSLGKFDLDPCATSFYLLAMRRRAEAATADELPFEATQQERQEEAGEQEPPRARHRPGPASGQDTGKNPMDRSGRPRFGHPKQKRLPFSEEFERIPYFMLLKPRTKTSAVVYVMLPKATLKDLLARRALIRGAMSTELPQLNRLIEILKRYDNMRPGIQVKEALELRATARRKEEA